MMQSKYHCLLYADSLVLYSELEEDLRAMVGWFVELCRRRGLKINAVKSKMKELNELECEVHIDMIHSEDVSELKYFGMCFG